MNRQQMEAHLSLGGWEPRALSPYWFGVHRGSEKVFVPGASSAAMYLNSRVTQNTPSAAVPIEWISMPIDDLRKIMARIQEDRL